MSTHANEPSGTVGAGLPRLTRSAAGLGPAAPVRIVHLGLGNFFRAHQAMYTDHSADAGAWGIAAFTGRRADLADALAPQGGLYTLITRGPDGDEVEIVRSVSAVHPAADHAAWLRHLADPAVAVVSCTVTEAGYHRRADGSLDLNHPEVRADLAALQRNRAAAVTTAPGKLLAGLLARAAADAGPIAVLPCDNLPENGAAVARVVRDAAAALEPDLPAIIERTAMFATCMVDRITPRATAADRDTAELATGFADHAPVVTEPFHEWVISGEFPAGRPAWESAGALLVTDVRPYEQRKLWLLNGSHSLLAYAGSARGHLTVAEASADPTCRGWVEQWWDEAARNLPLPDAEIAEYRAALLQRYANQRIRHLLAQIAADGSQKIPVRVLPVLRAERAAGRRGEGSCRVVAAWICHLRGRGAPVSDVAADRWVALAGGPPTAAVPRVLQALDPALVADDEVCRTVLCLTAEMGGPAGA